MVSRYWPRALENSRQELRTLKTFAEFYQEQGNTAAAISFYQRAIPLARTLGFSQEEALMASELNLLTVNAGARR